MKEFDFNIPNIFYWKRSDIPHSLPSQLITDCEKKAADDFKSQRRVHDYLWGRFLIRKIFAASLQITIPSDFKKHSAGSFLPIADYYFSLSHNPIAIGLAIVKNGKIGLDIDSAKPGRKMDEIIANYGNAYEKIFFKTINENEKEKYFYKLWTLKESFGKATGLGLQENLKELELDLKKNLVLKNSIVDSCQMFHVELENTFISLTCLNNLMIQPKLYRVGWRHDDFIIEKMIDIDFEHLPRITVF